MRSIRSRLTRRLLAGAFLIAACGGAAAFFTMRLSLTREFDLSLLARARTLQALTEQGDDGRVELEKADMSSLGFGPDDANNHFEITLANGEVLARSASLRGAGLPWPENTAGAPVFTNITLPRGVPGRAVAVAFAPNSMEMKAAPAVPARARIVLASSRQSLDDTLGMLLAGLGLSAGLLLLNVALLVPWVLRRTLRPLDMLADQAARITADSLAARFPVEGIPLELKPIADRLNELLARMEASFERERLFSADLAHELRTPLAELRAQTELVLKWPDTRAATADAETLAITLRMEHLVTRLLALARSENGQMPAALERLAVGTVVTEAWRPFAAKASGKQLRARFQIPPGLEVESDPVLLREILANLFENAVAYTPAGGELAVEADLVNGGLNLRVTNTTRGLDAGDMDKMFNRFWRKEAARADSEHAGIGLALARAYARLLGLNLQALPGDGPCLTMRLSREG